MNSPEAIPNKYDELRALFINSISKMKRLHFDPRITNFYDEIRRTYSSEEYKHCLLWHLITASTPYEAVVNFDTPGGEIEDFIRNRLPLILEEKE